MSTFRKHNICSRLGYKVGDLFEVVATETTPLQFSNGSIIELIEDDGSFCPRFRLISGTSTRANGENYFYLDDVMPVVTPSIAGLYCLILPEGDNRICALRDETEPCIGTHAECLATAQQLRTLWPHVSYTIMQLVPAAVQS